MLIYKHPVKWANNNDGDSVDVQLEAVFCGHTHSTGGYKRITQSKINKKDYNLDTEGRLDFLMMTYYIETEAST